MTLSLRPAGLALALALAACSGSDAPGDGGGLREFLVDAPALTESSGLARSQREAGLYWSHNDSGGPTAAYAFDGNGRLRGTLTLSGTINLDWEDMSSFTEDGAPRLLLADVGDNGAIRPLLTLYVAEEPELPSSEVAAELRTAPLRSILMAYPDGPRDCESVTVDALEGYVYLLSKRDAIPRLYRVPLKPVLPLVLAEALGEISIPRAADGVENPESINWVTGMDFDPGGTRLAAVTLTQAYLYERRAGQTWAEALRQPPRALDLPDYPQIEAVTWTADGQALLISSEGNPAPAARVPVGR
jgi:hypothetical protein